MSSLYTRKQSPLALLLYMLLFHYLPLQNHVLFRKRPGVPDILMCLKDSAARCPSSPETWPLVQLSAWATAACLISTLSTLSGSPIEALMWLHHPHHSGIHTSNMLRSNPTSPVELWLPSRPPRGPRNKGS